MTMGVTKLGFLGGALLAAWTFGGCVEGQPGQQGSNVTDRGSTQVGGSCQSGDALLCGGRSPDGCWCDEQCSHVGDCCPDAMDACGLDECTSDAHCGEGYACSSASPRDCVPATKTVVVTGYVSGGSISSNPGAKASWQAACDAWLAATTEHSSGEVLEGSCGEPVDLDGASNYYLYASAPTLTLEVRSAAEPIVSAERPISGSSLSSLPAALISWREACDARAQALRAIYGDRFIAAACGEPKDTDPASNYYRFTADIQLHLTAAAGNTVTITRSVYGPSATNIASADAGWGDACNAWLDGVSALVGDRLQSHSCGQTEDIDPASNYDQLASVASAEVLTGSDGDPEVKEATRATGTSSTSFAGAAQSWIGACDSAIAAQREALGDRLIAAACGEPEDIDAASNYVRHER